MKNQVQIFDQRQVRSVWDEENEKWWFSVLDIIGILTDQPDYTKIRNYWKWLKKSYKKKAAAYLPTNRLVILTR
jgi:cell filamentation protein